MALWVAMVTQRAESGSAFPSMSPLISLNCRRTSSTILKASFLTASKSIEEMKKGSIPPRRSPTMTFIENMDRSTSAMPVDMRYAARRPMAAYAAEPIANPFPIAAVVLPTASSLSVMFLHLLGEVGHLRYPARVVRDGAVRVDRNDHPGGDEHAEGGDSDPEDPGGAVRDDHGEHEGDERDRGCSSSRGRCPPRRRWRARFRTPPRASARVCGCPRCRSRSPIR